MEKTNEDSEEREEVGMAERVNEDSEEGKDVGGSGRELPLKGCWERSLSSTA